MPNASVPGRVWRPVMIVIAIWVVALLIAWPVGNFPIDDDFSHSGPVRAMLVDGGRFEMPWFSAMTLVTHVLWATPFVLVAGFSYDVLRVSTLVLALAGLIGFWKFARQNGASSGTAAVLTAGFVFNPVVFLLTNSFMTDVPFAAWSIFAAIAQVYAVRSATLRSVLVAAAFAIAATMLRQTGLMLPLIFAPAFLLAHGVSRRTVMLALLPVCAAGLTYGAFGAWIEATGRSAANFAVFLDGVRPAASLSIVELVKPMAARLLNSSFHIAWYMLPIVLWTLPKPVTTAERARLGGIVALFVGLMWVSGRVGPWSVSHIYNLGLGFLEVRGGDLPSMNVQAPVWVFRVFTLAAAASGALLFLRALSFLNVTWSAWRRGDRVDAAVSLMLAGTVAASVTAIAVLMFFDRYVFPIIPLLAVLCVIGVPRSQSSWRAARVAALAVLAIYGAFGVAGTRDYFEWRRVHWAAVERVRDSGAYAVADIDGGLEFTRDNTKEVQPPTSPKVVVTLGDLPGFRRCETTPYRRLLAPQDGVVVVLVPDGQPCLY